MQHLATFLVKSRPCRQCQPLSSPSSVSKYCLSASNQKGERMKIIVFGASGRMGIKAVEQALEVGHIVTAFLYTLSKIVLQHPKLTLFHGS